MPPEGAEGRPEDNPDAAFPTTSRSQTADDTYSLGQVAADSAAAAAVSFLCKLAKLGVAVWAAEPADPREVGINGPEFHRPTDWQKTKADGSLERLLAQFRYPTEAYPLTSALCANMGGVVLVVDVDPRNGGDIEKVRNLLADLGARIFAEITSPSGGKHFYVAGHEALPSGKLPGFPGVDIQSFGRNVFLPGTWRWKKYGSAGYTIEFEDLDALIDCGDPEGAEALAQWVAEQRYKAEKKAKKRNDSADFDFERSQPWTGGTPDQRQQAYLDKVVEENAKKVAESAPGAPQLRALLRGAEVRVVRGRCGTGRTVGGRGSRRCRHRVRTRQR